MNSHPRLKVLVPHMKVDDASRKLRVEICCGMNYQNVKTDVRRHPLVDFEFSGVKPCINNSSSNVFRAITRQGRIKLSSAPLQAINVIRFPVRGTG
jgi:hypothetical protein